MVAGGAAAVALIGTSLAKGFSRLNAIDQATAKLRGLGNSASTVDKIMKNALASVKGTAFGLDEAATASATAVAAGVKPGKELTKYLTLVGDAATLTNSSFSDMARVMNKARTLGGAYNDTLQVLAERGLPVYNLLAKSMGKSTAEVKKLASEGKVSATILEKALRTQVGGAALESGKTFTGAWRNLQASLGRIGANLLSGLFPKMQAGLTGLTDVLVKLEPAAARLGAAIGSSLGAAVSKASDLIGRFQSRAGGASGPLEKLSQTGQQFGEFLRGTVLPAAREVGDYLRDTWGPILDQVVTVVATKVAPILASWVGFLYGRLYPAIFQIAQAVAKNLKPVLDQLAQTFSTQILPAVSRFLDKVRPLGPVLAVVASVSLKVLGVVAKLAAKVLGVLLPVVVKLAGFLAGTLFDTLGAMADYFVRGGKAAGRFVSAVKDRVGDAITFFAKLPGRILKALGDLGSLLYNSGKELIAGFARGIADKANDALNAVKKVASKIKDFFPGSPVKTGPLTSWNNGGAGKRLMGMLATGIDAGSNGVAKSAERAAKKVGKKLMKALKDAIKDKRGGLADLTSAFSDMVSGIASSFVPDLFSGSLGQLGKGLATGTAGVKAALAAIPKLTAAGLNLGGGFMQQLFASGNTQLIAALAANPAVAKQYESQFNALDTYSKSIGQTVAAASGEGKANLAEQKKTNQKLDTLIAATKGNPKALSTQMVKALDKKAGSAKKKKAKRK